MERFYRGKYIIRFRENNEIKTITMSEVEHVLFNRILLILNAAYKNNVDTLILGAFGCGVFGNDPAMVSNIFEILTCSFVGDIG